MGEKQSNEKKHSNLDNLTDKGVGIDLVGILCKIISNHKILYKAAGVGLGLGIIVALSIPKEYTVKVTLSPEMGSQKNNNRLAGLAASFLGDGAIGMGDGTDALNASLSADIVSSTPFLLELLDIKVSMIDEEVDTTSLKSYLDELSSPWWSHIIGLPSMIISGVKSLFADEGESNTDSEHGVIKLTRIEAKKINYLKKNIIASMDKKTAITEISVTLQDPKVTAIVADSVIQKLQKCIINYRTSKVKEDCAYLERLFIERQSEYYVAQKKYANYVDTHDNLVFQSVRTEQERLQNDMNLAYQVYSQVANQLQVARAKVQEEKPVFAVVEPAVIPLQSSGMGTSICILLFILLSVLGLIGWLVLGESFWNDLRNEIKSKNYNDV